MTTGEDDRSGLEALSPVDGRYRQAAQPVRELMSEAALIRERIRIEARWLLHLCTELPELPGSALAPPTLERARQLAQEPGPDAAMAVKAIERRINHDVKAVEYHVREQLLAAGAAGSTLELVHFGCTSEDINNLSYARLLGQAREVLTAALEQRTAELTDLAHAHADLPMLARTHGQPASPTTLGKELATFAARLARAGERFRAVVILGKMNGAVGNFNAHVAALPQVPWQLVSARFVESLGLTINPYTTQIEPHDWIAEYSDALAAINVILIDLARDLWGYISLGYLAQAHAAAEVGSSTMPHKVNPIDFENAEGNLGIANALLRHFAEKLPVSRWQRDLTDSTVLRNLGVALAHSLIAWRSLGRGLAKISPDRSVLAADLEDAWEVLGEAVQTVLRAHGVPEGYERLKEFTRGREIDARGLKDFIDSLPLPEAEKARLKLLTPQGYLGLAAELARSL
jgi:adenylosuccinate lyase